MLFVRHNSCNILCFTLRFHLIRKILYNLMQFRVIQHSVFFLSFILSCSCFMFLSSFVQSLLNKNSPRLKSHIFIRLPGWLGRSHMGILPRTCACSKTFTAMGSESERSWTGELNTSFAISVSFVYSQPLTSPFKTA